MKKFILPICLILGLLLVVIVLCSFMNANKNETVKCDNSKAIALLKEKNIADLTEAADAFMVQKVGDNYRLVFSDELNERTMYEGEFARFHMSEDQNSIKADYDKEKALVQDIDKDINEVKCTMPVTFSGFSTTDKKSTLTGKVAYTIHANHNGNVEVSAEPITEMFRSNFKPTYIQRKREYLTFTYKTGDGEVIENVNQLPLEEFGEFFNPLDY